MADSVARAFKGSLYVAHAWRAYGESLLRGSITGIDRSEVEKYVLESRAHHGEALAALLKRTKNEIPAKRIHLLKGEPGEVLPGFCKINDIDLLVMGTVARSGLSAALIGNTAETLANQVECSILAVKPDGFVSPVQLEPSVAAPMAS